MTAQTLTLDLTEQGLGAVTVTVRTSPRAGRLMLRLNPSGGAVLTMPKAVGLADARLFLDHHRDWLAVRLERMPKPVAFEPGAVIPLQDVALTLRHAPEAKRGVWIDDTSIAVSGRPEHFARRVKDFLKEEAGRRIRPLAFAHAKALSRVPARVSLRDTRSRWGSCSSAGDLSFSWRLVLAPVPVLAYVVAHEVAHLAHMNHSPEFWAVVRTLHPELDFAKRWLKRNGNGLFRYG